MNNLQMQIDELKNVEINSVQKQIEHIKESISILDTTDVELREYIETLQRQKDTLVRADSSLSKSISDLKTELKGDISTAQANVLAQLQAYKTNIDAQIAGLNTSIETLRSKGAELKTQIDNLKTYVDNGIQGTKDWASATFATLTQYNTTAGIVATIQGEIPVINERLAALEAVSIGVTKQEFNEAIAALNADHQAKLNQAVTNCNNAISTARTELTTAYTTAIQEAISTSESSMRTWVNTQLTGYYTIAQTDAKVASLKTSLEGQLSSQKTYLEGIVASLDTTLSRKIRENASDTEECRELIATCNRLIGENAQAISNNASSITRLRADLATARTEITTAYTQAIGTAINTLNGQLTGQIATEVSTLNTRIDNEVATINTTIETLTARVTQCEKDIKNIKNTIYAMQQDIEDLQEQVAAILARIQSIAFVPAYSDGKVPVSYTDNGTLTPGTAVLDFELQPASTAAELAQVWQTALKMKAVYTITKAAPETVLLPITSVVADNGYLAVTVSGSSLSEDFFRSRCRANAALVISDGNNELASEYVPLVPWTTDVISFGCPNFKAYLVENFDTDGDGEITEDEAKAVTNITASMLNITSLVGIEYFSNLETIDVSFNKLETVDLSHSSKLTSVLVNGNKLQSLSLANLSALQTLDCSNNKLTALNVSEAEGLTSLVCSNNLIGALNVKKNKALTELQCSNNQIAALDLKNNTALETLYCRKNNLSVLDITKLTTLKNFDCSNNSLASLNLYQNTLLETLYCGNNNLATLGVSANTALSVLNCDGNALSALDLSQNAALGTLICANNALTSLDVSRNAALEAVDCRGNVTMAKLWVKDAAQAAALTVQKEEATLIAYNDGGINIPDANLKNYLLALFDDDEDGEISILEAENVQNVNCSGRSISDLTGLQDCPNLKYLNFNGNTVSTVNLPNMSKLETIVAYGNPIELLNVNNDAALTALYLQNVNTNALSGTALSINAYDQASTLYLAFAGTQFTTLNLTNSAVLTSFDIAEDIQLTKLVASGNPNVTAVDLSTLTALTYLDLNACGLTALNVDSNINLETLYCSNNKIAALNLDNNVELVLFNSSDNQLSTLRVTNNTLLQNVDVSNNNLVNINVRQNLALQRLVVSGNADITALALGYNKSLQILKASNTGLTDIDLSSNTSLRSLTLKDCSALNILDLTANTALAELYLTRTPITTLDVSNNIALTALNVSGTSIATLDVSDNTALTALDVSNNISLATLRYNGCTINATGLKIGVIVEANAKQGVVFSSSGAVVKIVSTDEVSKKWDYYGTTTNATSASNGVANTNKIPNSAAAKWCQAKGSAWYLPAKDELSAIYKNKAKLNTTLSSIGETQLGTGYYWSSTEGDSYDAYNIAFNNGNVASYRKDYSFNVRAIRVL